MKHAALCQNLACSFDTMHAHRLPTSALQEYNYYYDTHSLRINVSNMRNMNTRDQLESTLAAVLQNLAHIEAVPSVQIQHTAPGHVKVRNRSTFVVVVDTRGQHAWSTCMVTCVSTPASCQHCRRRSQKRTWTSAVAGRRMTMSGGSRTTTMQAMSRRTTVQAATSLQRRLPHWCPLQCLPRRKSHPRYA